MKVVYFADSLPPIADGVSHTMCRLADSLLANNVQFQMISPFQPGENYRWNSRVIKFPQCDFRCTGNTGSVCPKLAGLPNLFGRFNPILFTL